MGVMGLMGLMGQMGLISLMGAGVGYANPVCGEMAGQAISTVMPGRSRQWHLVCEPAGT